MLLLLVQAVAASSGVQAVAALITCTEAMSKKFKVKQRCTFTESVCIVIAWRWWPHPRHCAVDTCLSVFVSRFHGSGGGEINKTKSRGSGVPVPCVLSALLGSVVERIGRVGGQHCGRTMLWCGLLLNVILFF